MNAREELAAANPDALLADGLEGALVGYTINTYTPHVAVYDAIKCVEILMRRDGMTRDDAEEYLERNTFCAYVGPNGPLYVRTIIEDEENAAEEGLLAKDREPKHQGRDLERQATQAGCGNCSGRCGEGKKEGRKKVARNSDAR